MDPAIQDYLNNVQESESLKSAIEGKLQLKQERLSEILGAFQQLGLPAGLEGLQSLREYAIKNGNKFLGDDTEGAGEGTDILENLKSFLPQTEQLSGLIGGLPGRSSNIANAVRSQANNALDVAQSKVGDIVNAVKTQAGKVTNAIDTQSGNIGDVLERQVASRLPYRESVQKFQDIGARLKTNIGKIRDGELTTPEQQTRSLLPLTREDLNARLPTGGNFQSEIEGLTGSARNQYLRILEGDPSEMGTLLPEHLYDHALYTSQQLRNVGILNPQELAPELRQGMADVLQGLPVPKLRTMAKFTPEGEQTTQPATTSDRIANILTDSINPQTEDMATQARQALNPQQEPQPDTATELRNMGTDNIAIEQPATPEIQAVAKEATDTTIKGIGDEAGEATGEAVGEALGESAAADALGPIGAIVGLGTLVASLVESFKKENMPNLSVPVLQAGTD